MGALFAASAAGCGTTTQQRSARDAGDSDVLAADGGTGLSSDASTADAGDATDAGGTIETDGRLSLVVVDTDTYPLAACNDGSAPVMYVRAGSAAHASQWVLWFEGGGGCADVERCQERIRTERELMSSEDEQAVPFASMGGILSRDARINPDFAEWNHAWFVYCSSDEWTGAGLAYALPGVFPDGAYPGVLFRGAYNVDALLGTLREGAASLSSLADATEVIVAGSSAGAAGARAHVDAIASSLPAARVIGLSDAAMAPPVAIELGGLDPDTGDPDAPYFVHSSRVDASCLAAESKTPWKCRSGYFLLTEGYIETPMFFSMDQWDPKTLSNWGLTRSSPRWNEARAYLSQRVRETIGGYASTGGFAPRSANHVYAVTSAWHSVRVGGKSLATLFGNWYRGRGETLAIEPP